MERLTYYIEAGKAATVSTVYLHEEVYTHETAEGPMQTARQFITGEIVNKLADYEDIGLTPGEIKALATINGGWVMNIDECAHKIFKVSPPRRPAGAICPHCGTQLAVAYHEERLYSVKCAKCETLTLVKARNPYEAAEKVGIVARPAVDYHEDYGDVLWWHFPIEEPPEVGTPDTYDRYGRPVITEYHTHWTPIPIPNEPKREGEA